MGNLKWPLRNNDPASAHPPDQTCKPSHALSVFLHEVSHDRRNGGLRCDIYVHIFLYLYLSCSVIVHLTARHDIVLVRQKSLMGNINTNLSGTCSRPNASRATISVCYQTFPAVPSIDSNHTSTCDKICHLEVPSRLVRLLATGATPPLRHIHWSIQPARIANAQMADYCV